MEDWEKEKSVETPKDESWIKASSEKAPKVVRPKDEKKDGEIGEEVFDILVYGLSNAGKTYFACTAPEPIIILDTESRSYLTKRYQFPDKDIEIINLLQVKDTFNAKDFNKGVDIGGTVDKITEELMRINQLAKDGKITGGTVVIDSISDVWSWCQYSHKEKLAKVGKVDMVTGALQFQPDWSIITASHSKILMLLRNLLRYDVNIISTARMSSTPSYILEKQAAPPTMEEEIRSQKDVPFWHSTILKRTIRKMRNPETQAIGISYQSEIKKLETLDIKDSNHTDLDFQKLYDLRTEYRKQLKEKQLKEKQKKA